MTSPSTWWGRRATRIAKTRSMTLRTRWCGSIKSRGRIPARRNSTPTIRSMWIWSPPSVPTSPLTKREHVAHATLAAIMGRTAAYTGKEVKWDEIMDSQERLGPTEYAMGPVPIKAEVPVPGNAANIAKHARAGNCGFRCADCEPLFREIAPCKRRRESRRLNVYAQGHEPRSHGEMGVS